MKYFTFPMETLRVTQDYNGTTSHLNHSTGTPKDYPIDLAGADGNQSAIFARVPLKIVTKRGIGNSATNTVWLETTEKVKTPTFEDIAWITLTHWNDNDTAMKKYNVGDIIPEGAIICYEGTDGATANHIHLVCGKGHCDNWVQNSKGSWVMKGTSKKPEEVMYIDKNFTSIKTDGDLKWLELPKDEEPTKKDDGEELKKQINELNKTIKTLTSENEKLKANQEKHNLKSYTASQNMKCYVNLKKDETIEYQIV